MDQARNILKKYWGYNDFRPGQIPVVQSVLDGRDTLALLPTGGGKSICYQVPALCKEGLCVVISPLIALMKDQVAQLQQRKIQGVCVVSGMHFREIDRILDNCIYGKTKFLYLSPERLGSELVRERLKSMNVNLIAIDEAHCISQWGYDFRPPYLKIAEIRPLFPEVPLLALTATATGEVIDDIQEKLCFREPRVLRQSFARENLIYVVQNEADKPGRLLKICHKLKGSGIVYVRTRRRAVSVAEHLCKNGISATSYHAGMQQAERSKRQEAWMKGHKQVIAATNAFGMGIDKPDVRWVVHIDIPESPEAYFQEAGRAGRDGKRAYAILLYTKKDIAQLKEGLEHRFPPIREIKQYFQGLANYLRVAEGSGADEQYPLDLMAFCQRYHFNPLKVFHALQILEKEGIITLSTGFADHSEIMVTADKESLYESQVADENINMVLQTMFRSYSGLFSYPVRIDENLISERSSLARSMVDNILEQLQTKGYINYHKRSGLPKLSFCNGRPAAENLRISKENYLDRRTVAEKKYRAMIGYVKEDHLCRSRALLAYFGETDTENCGHCDVCLHPGDMPDVATFKKISSEIERILKHAPESSTQLAEMMDIREEQLMRCLEWLSDNQKIKYRSDNKLEWLGEN